jgi:hypothetical protein
MILTKDVLEVAIYIFYVNLFYEIEIRVCVFLMFYVLFVVIIMHLKLIVDERRKRKEEKENKKKGKINVK